MAENVIDIINRYKSELTENVLPFWLKYGMDKKNGGIYTCLDRDGTCLDTDKSVWFQGRALWAFATAYSKIERKPEYLEASVLLAEFLDKHCFDTDGRMFFRVTSDGRPVVKRLRYFFSETFAIIGYAAYAKASGIESYREKAWKLYKNVKKIQNSEGILIPKVNPETRPLKSHADYMIMINVLSELREIFPEYKEELTKEIDDKIYACKKYFIHPELKLVLETVGPNGEFISDHFEGRIINPGHAIEGAWFIMNEGVFQNRRDYIDLGLSVLDWMWDIGWDKDFGGGIIQYRDAKGLSLSEYHQDMKFWWPQCEAVIANLMAFAITGNELYLNHFNQVDKYISDRFIDKQFGEWFGYFHRDGTLATPIKGNLYKGPFHIPRMYIKAIEILSSLT